MGDKINSLYDCVVYISAPVELRLSRIKNREVERFGARVLPGGDMYKKQNEFHEFVKTRTTEKIENWLKTISCKIIKLDGTKPVEYNVNKIKLGCK